jgi:hypothetical protein
MQSADSSNAFSEFRHFLGHFKIWYRLSWSKSSILNEYAVWSTMPYAIDNVKRFTFFCRYIYSDIVIIPKDKVGQVLYASEKYMLPNLNISASDNASSSDCKIISMQSADSSNAFSEFRHFLGHFKIWYRLSSMDQDFFTTEVSTREILNKDEMLSVYRSFNGIKNAIFSEEKRKVPEANRVIRYGSISTFLHCLEFRHQ